MSKYIIELDDRIKLVTSVGVTENGVVYTTSDYVHNLEELNSDYINENFGELQDEAYQAGMDKAWEAAQRVVCKTEAGGMTLDTLQEVFGVISPATIMQSNTAQEAIGKIKAYEDGKHSDRIEVGDEVQVQTLSDGVYAVVGKAKCEDMECNPVTCYSLLCSKTGEVIEHDVKDDCTDEWEMPRKTGKHYDHISNLLEAMRE